MMWTIWMDKTRGIFLSVGSMVLLLILPVIFHGIILEKDRSHWLINSQAARFICSVPPVHLQTLIKRKGCLLIFPMCYCRCLPCMVSPRGCVVDGQLGDCSCNLHSCIQLNVIIIVRIGLKNEWTLHNNINGAYDLFCSRCFMAFCSVPPVQLEECPTLFALLSDNRPAWPLHHLVHCTKAEDEYWLKYVSSLLQQRVSLENEVITWASYNSHLIGVESVKPRAEIGMFPMMRHGMELTKKETRVFHNPSQNAVLGADEPMYAIVK